MHREEVLLRRGLRLRPRARCAMVCGPMTTQIRTSMNPVAALFVSVLLGVTSALGATFSANPTIDALVSTGPTGNLVNNNYGGAGSLSLSPAGLEMGELQSVLQFNVAGA